MSRCVSRKGEARFLGPWDGPHLLRHTTHRVTDKAIHSGAGLFDTKSIFRTCHVHAEGMVF